MARWLKVAIGQVVGDLHIEENYDHPFLLWGSPSIRA